MTPEDLERFVDAFIVRARRARWKTLIASPGGRARLAATFAHGHDFDPRWAERLGTQATAESVVARMRAKGARGDAYVLCEHTGFDGTTIPLEEAVGEFFAGGWGTYLVCDPTRLAYYESEEAGGHYLLSR